MRENGKPEIGTALKPAHESIVVARKKISERTVAANVLKHGTGGLNIDRCRVGHSSIADLHESQSKNPGRTDTVSSSVYGLNRPQQSVTPAGRWPANVVLSHPPACRRLTDPCPDCAGDAGCATCAGSGEVGRVERVRGSNDPRKTDGTRSQRCGNEGWDRPWKHTEQRMEDHNRLTDPDGTEPIPAWECVDGCPVRVIGERSGVRPSGSGNKSPRNHDDNRVLGKGIGYSANPSIGGDTGTAARFFHNFPADDPGFFYCAKASRRERNEGCDGFTNRHATVKPIALMRHLCALVTPEGGMILDPFLGSGSTGVAALKEGFDFIGIEQDAEYMAIARARIAHAAKSADAAPSTPRRKTSPPRGAEKADTTQRDLFAEVT